MDCSPAGSSVHGILQARILEWVAISYSVGSCWPRDQTQGLNPGLLHCRQILHQLSPQGSPMNHCRWPGWLLWLIVGGTQEGWRDGQRADVISPAREDKQVCSEQKQLCVQRHRERERMWCVPGMLQGSLWQGGWCSQGSTRSHGHRGQASLGRAWNAVLRSLNLLCRCWKSISGFFQLKIDSQSFVSKRPSWWQCGGWN